MTRALLTVLLALPLFAQAPASSFNTAADPCAWSRDALARALSAPVCVQGHTEPCADPLLILGMRQGVERACASNPSPSARSARTMAFALESDALPPPLPPPPLAAPVLRTSLPSYRLERSGDFVTTPAAPNYVMLMVYDDWPGMKTFVIAKERGAVKTYRAYEVQMRDRGEVVPNWYVLPVEVDRKNLRFENGKWTGDRDESVLFELSVVTTPPFCFGMSKGCNGRVILQGKSLADIFRLPPYMSPSMVRAVKP